MKRLFVFASVGAIMAIGAVLVAACGPQDAEVPASDADCKDSKSCRTHGRCTFEPRTQKCVVGSSADCAQSDICQKENLCIKVGETCGKE
ncbi:MAG: hypothetical protein U0271_22920 [Polyangiaceae bacterium]